MKKVVLIVVGFLFINLSYAQDREEIIKWHDTKLRNKKEYKNAEPTVMDCARYLLSHPYDHDDVPYHCAERLVLNWMTGTKDYHFIVASNISKYYTNQNGLLVIYMAALAKLGLEQPDILHNNQKAEIEAMSLVAKYCDNPANKVEVTPAIERLIKAYREKKLEDLLDK